MPIHCSVNVDISVVCVPGCLPCAHARYLQKKDFSVKCCLLAFNIVAQGPVVSLALFVSRAFVASYHAYHIYPRPVFSSEKL